MLNLPRPTTVVQMKRVLGLFSYYRRYCKNFATITAPLYKLCQKNEQFIWGPEQENAFVTIKKIRSSPPVLAFPRKDCELFLETDASKVGVSAILSQKENGHLRPVCFSSQILNKTTKILECVRT